MDARKILACNRMVSRTHSTLTKLPQKPLLPSNLGLRMSSPSSFIRMKSKFAKPIRSSTVVVKDLPNLSNQNENKRLFRKA